MAAPFMYRSLVSCLIGGGRSAFRDKVSFTGPWRSLFTTAKCGNTDTTDAPQDQTGPRDPTTDPSQNQTGPRDPTTDPSQNKTTTDLRDPFPVFIDQKVQELLTRITGVDYMKIAGPQKKPLETPKYKLLTDQELAQELQTAKERLNYKLQMPPYMNPRIEHLTPLSVDPDLAHFDTSTYVFTDISYGLKDRERNVVIRETDGTLRIAPWSVKERMNHIFNPREGREYFKPKMFEEHNIERMISEKRYVYILDRSCCQMEPDDPDFIRVTHRVYNALNATKEFHALRSTRHFGPMAFYLTWNKMIDYLLLDMMNRDLVSDVQDLVRLFCIIHPDSQCSVAIRRLKETDHVSQLKAYIETESRDKAHLELALQAMEDARKSKEETERRSTS